MADAFSQINSLESLQVYLEGRPVAEAQLVAARCALRLMPLLHEVVGNSSPSSEKRQKAVALTIFRASFIALTAAKHVRVLLSAEASWASAALDNVSSKAGSALVDAATAAVRSVADPRYAAARATDAAYALIKVLNDVAWQEIRADLLSGDNEDFERAAAGPLWRSKRVPAFIKSLSDQLEKDLTKYGGDWGALSNWLADRTHGIRNDDPAATIEIASNTDQYWAGEDTDAIVHDLAVKLKASVRDPVALEPDWDFFLSYAFEDTAFADEISEVVRSAGFRILVYLSDRKTGAPIVDMISDRLRAGGRFIALLSPNYEASPVALTELRAAELVDHGSKQSKLLRFVLAPTGLVSPLPDAAFTSLVGLSAGARRAAILDAITYTVRDHSTQQARSFLAQMASPDVFVTHDNKLDAGPNRNFDVPYADADLIDLPSIQRTLAGIIVASLPGNSPPVIGHVIDAYRQHLEERAARPIVGLLRQFGSALTKEYRSTEFEVWGDGLSDLFESFLHNHQSLLTHFPRDADRERLLSELTIDEDAASGSALIKPVEEVAAAVEIALIGSTSPAFDRVIATSVLQAKDIDSLSPDSGLPATSITPRRRFVLGQIGFWERLYNAVGTTATIAGSPQAQMLLHALQTNIQKFLNFIHVS
jgi:hypothetical protein